MDRQAWAWAWACGCCSSLGSCVCRKPGPHPRRQETQASAPAEMRVPTSSGSRDLGGDFQSRRATVTGEHGDASVTFEHVPPLEMSEGSKQFAE